MATRKKHHYIPQFYLRKFSVREEGKTIGLYHHKSKVFFPEANIRHQACEKYLYGKDDEVEAALSRLESNVSRMLDTMRIHFVPPSVNDNAFAVFKRYTLYQMYRTVKAGNELTDTLNKAFHAVWKFQDDYEEKYKDLSLRQENPALLSLANAERGLPFMGHLACKLLVNLSYLPFITSDNPVVTYNQFMEMKGRYIGATAIVSKGLQIFFPVYPRMMVCLYDPYVYKYGDDEKHTIVTESEQDVDQLNTLQFLSSESQLYFNDFISEEYITSLVDGNLSKKENTGPFSKSFKTWDNGKPRHFIFSSSLNAQIKLNLPFIEILPEVKDFNTDTRYVIPRHTSFDELDEKMGKDRRSNQKK